jgi:hypothetical protein
MRATINCVSTFIELACNHCGRMPLAFQRAGAPKPPPDLCPSCQSTGLKPIPVTEFILEIDCTHELD